jgi:lipopolysaccharide transport system permease protein
MKMPDPQRFYFSLNPLASLIANYRKVLLNGAWPDWSVLLLILAASLLIHYAALKIFHRFDGHYLKIL